MFASFSYFLFALGSLGIPFYVTTDRDIRIRILSFGSFVLILFSFPIAATTGLLMTWIAFLAIKSPTIIFRGRSVSSRTPAAVALIMLLVILRCFEGVGGDFVLIGLSFALIRLLVFLYGQRSDACDFKDLLLLVFFLPLYASGPIAGINSLKEIEVPAADVVMSAVARVICGLFLVGYVAPEVISGFVAEVVIKIDLASSTLSLYCFWYVTIVLLFLKVYISFSGVSSISIGLSRLFGIKCPENFDFPLMATNIQDFWRRWHITMSKAISGLIFMRMIRKTGRPNVAIMATFLVMGAWHEISIGYLIWGLGHGASMVLFVLSKTRIVRVAGKLPAFCISIASRIYVISIVSLLSYQANHFNWEGFFASLF